MTDEQTDLFVNVLMDAETLSALETIRINREYTTRSDAVRYAIKLAARKFGWNPDALPQKKAKAAA